MVDIKALTDILTIFVMSVLIFPAAIFMTRRKPEISKKLEEYEMIYGMVIGGVAYIVFAPISRVLMTALFLLPSFGLIYLISILR